MLTPTKLEIIGGPPFLTEIFYQAGRQIAAYIMQEGYHKVWVPIAREVWETRTPVEEQAKEH